MPPSWKPARVPAKLGVFGGALLIAFAGAWGVGHLSGTPQVTPAAVARHDMSGMDGMDMSGMDMSSMSMSVAPQGLQVEKDGYALHVEQNVLPAGVAVPFRFTVDGPDGRPVTSFTRHQEELLHLVVVRRDFAGFQHVHPTMAPDGTWTQMLRLPGPGSYRAYMQFVTDTREMTLGVDLTAPGDYSPLPLPPPSTTATVDGLDVAMVGVPRPGRSDDVTFHVTRGGVPVTTLQPYLGALGHLVALREGDMAYVHVHPRTSAGSGPDVVFTPSSPAPGDYRLYFQFRVDGALHVAEFTVPVR